MPCRVDTAMLLTRPVVPGAPARPMAVSERTGDTRWRGIQTSFLLTAKHISVMTRFYIIKLITLCWAIAGLATTDNIAINMAQELAFTLMGTCIERTHLDQTTESAFELLDFLAA